MLEIYTGLLVYDPKVATEAEAEVENAAEVINAENYLPPLLQI